MSKPPAREQAQVNIRMPDGLRDRIKGAAALNNRSMNAEIVAALEQLYPGLEGIEVTLDRINRMIAAAREIGAEHILKDLELDLETLVSAALQDHKELEKVLRLLSRA